MSDRGGQFPQRRHARHVCQLRLRFLQMATNANAALRWLSSDSPNLVEAHEAIRRIVRDGDRAGKIIEGGSCSGQESAAEDGLARPQRGDRRSRCYGAQ